MWVDDPESWDKENAPNPNCDGATAKPASAAPPRPPLAERNPADFDPVGDDEQRRKKCCEPADERPVAYRDGTPRPDVPQLTAVDRRTPHGRARHLRHGPPGADVGWKDGMELAEGSQAARAYRSFSVHTILGHHMLQYLPRRNGTRAVGLLAGREKVGTKGRSCCVEARYSHSVCRAQGRLGYCAFKVR